MVQTRWWSLILLLTAAMAVWGGAQRAHAVDVCEEGRLKARNVSAKLDFDYHDRSYAQVISTLTISVSAKEWPSATDLALSEKSALYQKAMRCLLRGDDNAPRSREWRFHDPRVSVRDDLVTVNYEATAWIEQNRPFLLGPWRIEVNRKGDNWRVFLRPPNTLKNAKWGQVEVQLDGLEATNVFPPPSSADPERLVWSEPEPFDVRVEVDPPWQRSFNVGERWWSLGWVGVATWWAFTSLVSVVAVLHASRKQPGASVSPAASGTPGPVVLARVILLWAVLSAVVAAVLRVLIVDRPLPAGPSWRHLVVIALALALVLAARPWCHIRSTSPPTAQETAAGVDVKDAQRRRVWAVSLIASAVAVSGFLSVVALPGLIGLTLLALGTLWLWLAAMAAWAWRFLREGAMARRSWNKAWDEAPIRSTVVATALLAVMAAALLTSFWWTHARRWSRAYWLIDESETARDREWGRFLVQFPYSSLTWVYAYAWLLTGIALVGLLQIRVRDRQGRPEECDEGPPLGPAKADLLLTASVFTLSVGFRQVEFAGSNLLFGVWLLLMIASLYAVVTVGRRFSVLGRTEEEFRVRRLGTKRRRHVLLNKAHEFRNLHHKLYALDRGRTEGDLTREELEKRLDGLHHWLFAGRGNGRPPAQISVLDAALSWGPGEDWWDNAKSAARLAFCFGFPASLALVWLSYLKDDRTQMATFQSLTGLPEIAAKCCAWQVAWAGGGLVLGALWRVLPGRRSPVRALSLTAAYAIPVCVGAVVTQITDTELGYVFLHVALMLLVLTLTSIWMDMETFSEERRFWPSGVGLLLSVYQLRGLSAQVAYLAAQLAIVVSVWRSLAGSNSVPK
ncbi:DUF6185 family protein [Streptomyces sp. SPB4]|uniref:DUF6185 family protein n=1 Tax=Streptomyces TaxID=1883 RepID=UPI00247504D6|nr:DUF6185 family protein [Streptomyces sp. SPB4]MDH6539740.1 hypothetical protein [Streptomyces sp. SPB4]